MLFPALHFHHTYTPRGSEFYLRPVHVGFMVDEVIYWTMIVSKYCLLCHHSPNAPYMSMWQRL